MTNSFIAHEDVGLHLLESDPGLRISTDALQWNIQGEDMATLNKISGLIEGQYGSSIPLTVVDDEGIAVDLSTYTAILIKALSPDARTTLSFTGGFVSATGGQLSFSPSSGNTFDRDGTWLGQVQLSDTGILDLTVIFEMEVVRQL